MIPSKGYYSIIQYCPDLSRFEAANVGVLLFCPERNYLKAMTNGSNARIIRFFGSEGHDWKRINAIKRGLEERVLNEPEGIQSVEDLQRFISLRANLMQFTVPRPMKVIEPDQDLAQLYEKVIGEPARRRHAKSLRRYLGDKLTSAGLEKKIVRDISVSVPVLQKEVEIPFGFQNGRFNLINPVRFAAADAEGAIVTACKYAVEGRSLYENADPERGDLQLVVVGQFRPKDQETLRRVKHVFDEHSVRLYRTEEIPSLIDEIRTTGKEFRDEG